MVIRNTSRSIPLLALLGVIAVAGAGLALWRSPSYGAEQAVTLAAPAVDMPQAAGATQTAVLAGAASGACRACSNTSRG